MIKNFLGKLKKNEKKNIFFQIGVLLFTRKIFDGKRLEKSNINKKN